MKKSNRKIYRSRFYIFAAFMLLFFLFANKLFFSAVAPHSSEEVVVQVPRGAALNKIAEMLSDRGLVRSEGAYVLYTRVTGDGNSLKAGEYVLSPSMSAKEINEILISGVSRDLRITVPEGYTCADIASLFAARGLCTEDEFRTAVAEGEYGYDFLDGLPKDNKRLEGYLFPDTYLVPVGMDPERIIGMMLKRFDGVYSELGENLSGLDMRDTVILASLVEAETLVDSERPLVASVFLNRLSIGMKLDCDSTIQYALPERKGRILYKDLELDSPYNTYIYGGLPPTPIGNPGKLSLEAVHNPAETSYFYFLAKKDNSGEHVFSRTYSEHLNWREKLGY